jgi:hypothetical protein
MTFKLNSTVVLRSGSVANSFGFEQTSCSAYVGFKGSLNIRFSIASKGGGRTLLQLEIPADDIRVLLEEMATTYPESAVVLSECTSLAVAGSMAMLEKARDQGFEA